MVNCVMQYSLKSTLTSILSYLGHTVKRNCQASAASRILYPCKHIQTSPRIGTSFNTLRMASSFHRGGVAAQDYDYFLVLDFEATCEEGKKIDPQEIIEFPLLKVNGKSFETEAIFHQYVQPQVHLELTAFCSQLTGIVQDMVDGQPHLQETLKSLEVWMNEQGLLQSDVKSIFVTCGDWDLKTMLPRQCSNLNIKPAGYFNQWINIKKAYCDVMGEWPRGMMQMLEKLGIKHEGRHHSGIDDCKNIAKILKALAEKGFTYKATGQIKS